ncbi:hypothetical protein AX17_000178 [Amanita inopinata Kibby_2008]|nr:hypothetical protein AX17_000178 [Amanita inopinata Kibby_2008]
MGLFSILPRALTSLFLSPNVPEHDVSLDLVATPTRLPPFASTTARTPRPADIPLEIIMTIFELLYYNDDLNIDTQMLKSCSLVCRAWSMPAQKLLYRHVTLQNQKALESFIETADRSTERGVVLGDSVRRLRIIMDHNQPLGIHQHSFAVAVTLCPNLVGVGLSLYGCAAPGKDVVGAPDQLRMRRPAPLFDDHTVQLLKSGPAIAALEFNNWSENEHTTNQLLQIWPTLNSLAVGGTVPHLLPEPSDPFPCALEDLRLNFQTPPSTDYMKWLLHNSAQSLRVLEFEREPPVHLLEYLITSHASTLCSLSLPSLSSHEQVSVLQKCTKLRRLRTESPSVFPVLYRQLPKSLEHMALGMDRDSSLHSILEAVKGRDSLKTITLQVWTGGELHGHLSKLKIDCAWKGVDLRITNDVRLFRLMTRGNAVTSRM